MKSQREGEGGKGPILIHTEIQFSSKFCCSKFSKFRGCVWKGLPAR